MGSLGIVGELKELRRGRGLLADDAPARVGPLLKHASGVQPTDSAAVVRRKVVLSLASWATRLPRDLRIAATVALALNDEADHSLLHERIQWLAEHLDRDPRTALRRVEQSFRLLAEQIDDQMLDTDMSAQDGWYVESVTAFLRMDLDPPELLEERRIVATRDSLSEITAFFSAPKVAMAKECPQKIAADMVYGGQIVEEEWPGEDCARFIIRFPEPLLVGQRHEYATHLSCHPHEWMRPYYILTPIRRCDVLRLCVRFDLTRCPRDVWRIEGALMRVVDGGALHGGIQNINSAGEVHLEFYGLRQGLSYGVSWDT